MSLTHSGLVGLWSHPTVLTYLYPLHVLDDMVGVLLVMMVIVMSTTFLATVLCK